MEIERFNELVEKHTRSLYALAYRLTSNSYTAEDMVQETFRSAWKTTKVIDADREMAWLSVILRRRITDMRRLKHFPELVEDGFVDSSIVDPIYIDNYSRNIQNALNQLDEGIRETLLLVVVGELTHAEAAVVQNIPIGTVLSRVNRARKQLRELLKEEECLV